jgi:predicted molibdopterin-dependent oxidoreductase YjgC
MKGVKRDSRPTWRILSSIINAINPKFKFNSVEDVFNEIASTIEDYRGLSYREIGNKGKLIKQKVLSKTKV